MNPTKRTLLIVNVIWTFIHFILAMMYSSNSKNGKLAGHDVSQILYPFSKNPKSEDCGQSWYYGDCPELIEFYDWSEFFLYAGIGWIAFMMYWLMNKK